MKDGNLRALEREYLKGFHLVTIETGFTGPGVPDMNYCYHGSEGWIENKACKGWQVKIRVEQVGWMLRRQRAGGKCFIFVRRQNASSNADELYVFNGEQAQDLSEKGINGAKWRHRSTGGPARWDWETVSKILRGG